MRKIGDIELTKDLAKALLAIGVRGTGEADVHFTVKNNTVECKANGTRVAMIIGLSSLAHDIASTNVFDLHDVCALIELFAIVLNDDEHFDEYVEACTEVLKEAVEE